MTSIFSELQANQKLWNSMRNFLHYSFTDSQAKEINGLLENGAHQIFQKSSVPKEYEIYNSQFEDELQNMSTEHASGTQGFCAGT